MKLGDRLEALRRFLEQTGERAGFDAEDRLRSFRRLLEHVRERAGLDLGFVLWDGSTVPADLAPDALAVVIADEGAVAALARKPKLETLTGLWVTRRIDLRGGTLFDVAERRPRVRTREIRKSLDKRLALGTLAKFLPVSRGGPWPLEAIPDESPSSGAAAENKRNIAYHYDVSNAFYALFLDREMVYSCGYATDWSNDIDRMQADKLEMICRKLRLKPGERLLDIGCGWGALVCHAAQHHGAIAYGITLSEEQAAYAKAKIERLGLGDRVTIEIRDYATLDGEFDKVVSVGMHEHIGIDNYPTYYSTVKRVLKADGFYLHHAITRPAKREGTFRRKRPGIRAPDEVHLPGRGARPHRQHRRQPRALRLRGARRRGLARALPAHLPALARPASRPLRRGGH